MVMKSGNIIMDTAKVIRPRIYPKIWDTIYLLTKPKMRVFNHLLEILPKSSILNICDLGCGYKPFKFYLENQGYKLLNYIGIDFSKENAKPDIVLDLDKGSLPFDDEYFDVVILSEVIEHLFNPFHALEEAIRVLKRGGYIYISTPFLFGNHGAPYDYFRFTDLFYKRYFSEKGLEIIDMKKAGSILSASLFIFNLFLWGIFKESKIIYPIVSVINLIGVFVEIILDWCSRKSAFIKRGKEHLYFGIAVLGMKK
jgi:SAM-dependent methyltransferase